MKSKGLQLPRWIKYLLLLTGLLLTFFGHILDQRNSWVVQILAPDYGRAIKAYSAMQSSVQGIKKSDPGFKLILDVLSKYVKGPIESISSLKARTNARLGFLSGYTGPTILLSVTFENGHTQELKMRELQPDIRKHFLDKPLFLWGNGIFYCGLFLVLVVTLADFFRVVDS